jgi:SPP1 gp7 family putative phage head morphogenesis protein
MRLAKNEKALRPVFPNVGIAVLYRKKLDALVLEMARSYYHWILAQYRETPPRLAQDEVPARELERELRRLGVRWQQRFEEAAPKLARWFAVSASRRSNDALKKILKDAGIAVEFKMSPAMRDAFHATVAENVGLIRSIASTYHDQVQGLVMRSVTTGRDLGPLAKELEARFGVTKRRAALIARTQNNMATATFTRVRQQEAGITEAIWLHSHGGLEPRPTHLANDGKKYNISQGWFDSDPKVRKRIWPGQLINCRCVSRSIIKGFS